MRGYFEIGIYHPKTVHNIGTLWRSAFQLGAAGIFVIGPRFKRQSSDTYQVWRHIPCRRYANLEHFLEARPYDCRLIGVEMGGTPLPQVEKHPARAQYLLGAEDYGLPTDVQRACEGIISLPSIGMASYNVSVAGSLVMYHRQFVAGTEKSAVLKISKATPQLHQSRAPVMLENDECICEGELQD